ncbi:MAG: NAD-dependent epimerase/dehydratase family protein [Gemmatimonadota bacterium]
MRVLITGGAGFIGSYFIERLIRAGSEVTVLDLAPCPYPGVHSIVGDVRDPAAVREAIQGVDRVLHLAAAHHDFGISEQTYFDVNEGAARVLVQAMEEHGVRELCFYSSVAVYGSTPPPRTEATPPSPEAPYGASKLAGEQVFRAWTDSGPDRTAWVIRPTVVFGPGNFANMFALIRQIARGRFLQIGEGTNIKSLAYVENLVDATFHLWEHVREPGFHVFNYADKPDLSSGRIADTIYRALGRTPPSLRVPLGLGLLLAKPFDWTIRLTGANLPISGARIRKLAEMETQFEADRIQQAGFSAAVPLSDGLSRMVRWYLDDGRFATPVRRLPPAEPLTSHYAATPPPSPVERP